jgi:hypothetical protein
LQQTYGKALKYEHLINVLITEINLTIKFIIFF